jgi:hypothetical protein
MKKLLISLAALLGAILMGVFLIVSYGFLIGPGLDKESAALDTEAKIWVDNVVPHIVSSWNTAELMKNGSSEFVDSISGDDAAKMMTHFSDDLGPLKHYNGSTGKVTVSVSNFKKTLTAVYQAKADFEKGSADILIDAIREDGQWKIYNFHVTIKDIPEVAR